MIVGLTFCHLFPSRCCQQRISCVWVHLEYLNIIINFKCFLKLEQRCGIFACVRSCMCYVMHWDVSTLSFHGPLCPYHETQMEEKQPDRHPQGSLWWTVKLAPSLASSSLPTGETCSSPSQVVTWADVWKQMTKASKSRGSSKGPPPCPQAMFALIHECYLTWTAGKTTMSAISGE